MRFNASALLLGASVLAVLVGFAVAGTSLVLDDAAAANALLLGGLVTAAAGVHGVLAWAGLAPRLTADRAEAWTAQADAFLRAGRFEYARTFYEEALRAGADPEHVLPRLVLAESRTAERA